jgi:hypothetical protein
MPASALSPLEDVGGSIATTMRTRCGNLVGDRDHVAPPQRALGLVEDLGVEFLTAEARALVLVP